MEVPSSAIINPNATGGAADVVNWTSLVQKTNVCDWSDSYILLDEDTRVALTFVGLVVIIFAALGNLLTIYAVKRYRRLQSVQNFYIASLAGADFVVGAFVMTFMLLYTVVYNGEWAFGVAMCEIWQAVDYISCTASLHSLCAIALDRYVVVSQPLRSMKRTKQKAGIIITVIWGWCCFSWGLVISVMRGTNGQSPQGTCYLIWTPWFASVAVAAVTIYIPILTVVTLFVVTLLEIRAQMKQMNERIRARSVSVNTSVKPSCKKEVVIAAKSSADSLTQTNCTHDSAKQEISQHLSSSDLYKNSEQTIEKDDSFGERKQSNSTATLMCELSVTSVTCPLPRKSANGYAKYSQSKSVDVSPTNSITAGKQPHITIRKMHSVDVASISRVRSRMVKMSLRGSKRTTDADMLMEYSEEMRSQRQNSIIRSRLSKQIKATKSVGLMLLAVLCCWLPFCVMWPMRSLCPCCISQRYYEISIWTNYLSSALNPILYQLCHPSFRRAFKRIFQGLLQRPFS